MAKNTNIKFGVRAPRESPYSTWILEEIFFETSMWPGHVTLPFLGYKC